MGTKEPRIQEMGYFLLDDEIKREKCLYMLCCFFDVLVVFFSLFFCSF